MSGTKKSKVHVTLRLDEDLYGMLVAESETRNSTHTMLISQIIGNYLLRDKMLGDLGFMPMGRDFVRAWTGLLDEDGVKKSAELGREMFRECVPYFFHEASAENFVRFLEIWLGTQGNLQKRSDHGKCTYTLCHNVSMRYSDFLEAVLFDAIHDVLSTRPRCIEKTQNLFSFEFDVD